MVGIGNSDFGISSIARLPRKLEGNDARYVALQRQDLASSIVLGVSFATGSNSPGR